MEEDVVYQASAMLAATEARKMKKYLGAPLKAAPDMKYLVCVFGEDHFTIQGIMSQTEAFSITVQLKQSLQGKCCAVAIPPSTLKHALGCLDSAQPTGLGMSISVSEDKMYFEGETRIENIIRVSVHAFLTKVSPITPFPPFPYDVSTFSFTFPEKLKEFVMIPLNSKQVCFGTEKIQCKSTVYGKAHEFPEYVKIFKKQQVFITIYEETLRIRDDVLTFYYKLRN